MTDLTISIINYKTKDLTTNCLNSVLQKQWRTSFDIWLVDNASEDGSVEYFKQAFPKVKLIENKKNLGFAGGHNLVLRKAKSDHYLVLNSDTEVSDNVIDEMVSFMEANPNCGISSCKVLGFDNKLQPNGGDLPFGLALINWLFNLESLGFKSPSFHRNDQDYYQTVREVGWVSGNFMMIRDKVINKLGGFDEKYFMYFEDVDLCINTKRIGFKIMLNPTVSIKHLSGGSLDDPHFKQWSGEYKGLLHFYQKEYGVVATLLLRLLIYTSTLLRIVAFTVIGKFNYSITYAKVITTI